MDIPEGTATYVSGLLTLPFGLRTRIFDRLPFPTLQVLHATHPYFREVIDLDPSKYIQCHPQHRENFGAGHVFTPPYYSLMGEMVEAAESDQFLARRELKPCAYCLRLRSPTLFAKKNMKLSRACSAFCLDCGLSPEHNLYQPGSRCDTQTQTAVYCQRCRTFKTGIEAAIVGKYNLFCRRCGEIADSGRRLEVERQREEQVQRATAARKAARRQRNARLKESAGSDYDEYKSDSTVDETASEAEFWMLKTPSLGIRRLKHPKTPPVMTTCIFSLPNATNTRFHITTTAYRLQLM
ncbi:hypothetical protein MMC26_007402 [Xylographa opegraphella]|nr:hypothetical protein [Xylographa opegraphella]